MDGADVPSNPWRGSPPFGDPDPRATLLRRLLLRRLADRPERSDVYAALLERSTQQRDPAAIQYYRLAGGDVDTVARHLTAMVENENVSAEDWVGRLRAVAQAPRYPAVVLPCAEVAAACELREVPGHRSEVGEIVLGLLVRSWIAADPLCGHDREALHRELRSGFAAMTAFLGYGEGALQFEVDRHESLARLWSGNEDHDDLATEP